MSGRRQIILKSIISNNFNGSTTNLSAESDLSNITNFILEKLNYGKINFSESVSLSSIRDIDAYVSISHNRIEINPTALPELNKPATLTLYSLTFSNPRILEDGEVCSSSICTKISYSNGNLVFNVTQFSVYSAEETPAPPPTNISTPMIKKHQWASMTPGVEYKAVISSEETRVKSSILPESCGLRVCLYIEIIIKREFGIIFKIWEKVIE